VNKYRERKLKKNSIIKHSEKELEFRNLQAVRAQRSDSVPFV